MLVNTDAGLGAALQGGCVAAGAAGLFALALALHARRRLDPGGGLGVRGGLGARGARGTLLASGAGEGALGGGGPLRGAAGAMGLALLAALAPLVWTAATTTPLAHRSTIAATPAVLRGIAPASASLPGLPPTAAGRSEAPRPRLFRLEPRRENGPFHSGDEIAREYHESLDTNIASRFGCDVLPGFEPGESTRFLRFGREIFPHLSATAFTRLLGVEWLVVRDPETLGLPFPVVATGECGSALLAAGAVRPRAFVTPRWRAAATPGQALEALAATGREDDPALVALVGPDPVKTQGPPQAPLSPCRARQPRPEEVRLDCDSPAGGYAVLLDEWAPGWSAAADGRPAPILLADGLFRAVPVEPGPHRIVFRYRTPGLRAGAALSLLAWLAGAAWLLWARRRRPI
jgi:Bacterial membrane protein YfhO